MGLIKAIGTAVGGVLADQWKEYIYCDALPAEVLVRRGVKRVGGSNTKGNDNIISDGSTVAVNEGQCMLIVENGKVVDFSNEAGVYTYQSDTEPSLLTSGWKGLKESFKNVGKRFTFGGIPANDQRVYYFNTKEIMGNKYGVGEVPFRDSEFNFTMKIRCYGEYSYRITNPLMFYTNVCGNVEGDYLRSAIDSQFKAEVQTCLQPALGRIALQKIAYDQLPLFTKEIAGELNRELTGEWVEKRGISVASFAVASVTPDAESAKKIEQFQSSRIYSNAKMAGGRLIDAQATAMETAAANQAGAMTGFMGLNFAQQSGGANPNQLLNQPGEAVPPFTPAQPEQAGPPAENNWICGCGHSNTSKFCAECGKPRPVRRKCDKCGYEPPAGTMPKFCPECGDVMDEKDNG